METHQHHQSNLRFVSLINVIRASPKVICYLIFGASWASQHIQYQHYLLEYISLFPCINPSSLADTTSSPDISTRFKFDLDTRPCAQFLASILDLDFLTKNLTTKNRYANCQRTLLFLSGHSIKVEPKNQCRIGISGFETNLLPQDLKFGPVTEKAFVLEVGLQTNHIIWKFLWNNCFVIDLG